MSRLLANRDGGKTDEYGTQLWHQRVFTGEIADGCQVVANASPNMAVRVQAGTLRIPTGSSPSNYWYEGIIDTASPGEGLTVTTANVSNPRKDYVVAYVDKSVTPSTSFTNNSNNMLKLAVVAGTPGSSPSYPNTSAIQTAIGGSTNPYVILGGILVGTGVTQVTNSDITDLRTMAVLNGSQISNPFKASAYRTGNQTVTASALIKVQLNAEDFDPNSSFDAVTNFRYTVQVTGDYLVNARVSNNGNGAIFPSIFKNGTEFRDGSLFTIATGRSAGLFSDLLHFTKGDYVELFVYTDNTTVVGGTYDTARMSLILLST